jgi:hypothetical protein
MSACDQQNAGDEQDIHPIECATAAGGGSRGGTDQTAAWPDGQER